MAHEFRTQLERLRQAFTAGLAEQEHRLGNMKNPGDGAQAISSIHYPEAQGKTIFIIDPDPLDAALCAAHLRKAGFEVEYFDNSHSCIERLYLDSPAAILMDPDFERSGAQALGNLHQIKALLTQETPIILMSATTDDNAKMRSSRAGSSDYLTKPLDFNYLLECLVNSITQHTKTQRVMIVDDDPFMTALQEEILCYAGMEVACVNEPLRSLELAGTFKPSLVILDMHMPEINGIELALLLRQDPEFLLLPIIFVTADTDINLHKSIKAMGVNALLTKPFDITDLISVCEQALADTSALKGRIARLTRQAQQPEQSQQPGQISHNEFFSAPEDELPNNIPSGPATNNPKDEGDKKPLDKHPGDYSPMELSRNLTLVLQPIITLEDAQINHFSVHTRVQEANGEPIAGGPFLSRITQPDKRLAVDHWILQQAVSAIAADSDARGQVKLFVHPSEDSLQESSFLSFVTDLLCSSHLRGNEQLVFMLEEAWVLKHLQEAKEIGSSLRNIHCGICVTHAGADEQLLNVLADLPVNYLHLSPSLTNANANTNPTLLEQLITAATGRGIQVIATEIENSHNLSSLWMQGVRLFEGFSSQPATTGFHLQNDIIFAKEFVLGN